jgi:hypothetical protein
MPRMMGRERGAEEVPEPVLISPVNDSVDLTGKDSLEFKWSSHESTRGFRRFYDFRLYEGSNLVESALVYKEEVPSEQYAKSLPSKTFENGKTYTWTLKQVYDEGRKSRRSYSTFKVKK